MMLWSVREDFGYVNANWRDAPSQDQKFVRKRAMQVPVTIQCGKLHRLRSGLRSSALAGEEVGNCSPV